MGRLKDDIEAREGRVYVPYQDHKGIWTVGVGHKMSNPFSDAVISLIFEEDFMMANMEYHHLPYEVTAHLSDARQDVLIEMIFQLGLNGTLNFKRMMKALKARDYETAALEIMDSEAARDPKLTARFEGYAKKMRAG